MKVIFLDAVRRDGEWIVSLLATDEVSTKVVVERHFSAVNDDAILAAARALAARVDQAADSQGKISFMPGQELDLTEHQVELTDEEKAARQWAADYQLLLRYKRSVAAGLRASDDAALAAQAALVLKNFLPAYEVFV